MRDTVCDKGYWERGEEYRVRVRDTGQGVGDTGYGVRDAGQRLRDIENIFLLLLNPPSNNIELQKIIAKYIHECYEIRKKKCK